MAILKHTSNKSTNYTDVIQYLTFQYDETMDKPILDDSGNLQLREEFYMDGINCKPMTFDLECKQLNKKYHKNQSYGEVKTHQYIISFDPKDIKEHGLTGEKAQKLGLEYARKNFPGHQILVATHTDGNNKSGNIHVHIVLNSLRKYDVPEKFFMERDCDHKAGYKHHQTKNLLEYLKMDLMELCECEGLNQVDLIPSITNNISHAESKVMQKGQRKLDQLNQEIIADGLTPTRTKFQTQKQYLKESILTAASKSNTLEEFKNILWEQYKIQVRDKRGRFSYLHPDREKAISERSLGTAFSKEELLSKIRKELKKSNQHGYQNDPLAIFSYPTNLRLVIDLQKCVKAQQNVAYARKVKISNLQQMAETLIFLQENQFDSLEQLQHESDTISKQIDNLSDQKNNLQDQIADLNKKIHYLGQYHVNKKYFSSMLKSGNKADYRKTHSDKIAQYDEARNFLKSVYPDSDYPDLNQLKNQRKQILTDYKSLNSDIHDLYKQNQKLKIVSHNSQELLSHKQVISRENLHL